MVRIHHFLVAVAVVVLLIVCFPSIYATGPPNRYTTDTPLYTVDASFVGEAGATYTGSSLAVVGDVNGDGLDDFVVGSHMNDETGNDAGKVYLITGHKHLWSTSIINIGATNGSFRGEIAGDWAGASVDGAGDVNGDGYEDFLIGAPKHTYMGASQRGKVYLIYGKAAPFSQNLDLSTADASFIGEKAQDYAGTCVAGAGDVNGDGYDDILIGAPEYDDAGGSGNTTIGRAYIMFGGNTSWTQNMDLKNADVILDGDHNNCWFGFSLDGGKDLNNDGMDDIVVGAYRADLSYVDNGKVAVYYGRTNWPSMLNIMQGDFSFIGEGNTEYLGHEVALIDDVNDDDLDDILLSAWYYSTPGASTRGKAYVIESDPAGFGQNMNVSLVDDSYFYGEDEYDQFGDAMCAAGDVNGDGYGDIFIGNEYHEHSLVDDGKAYLLTSSGTGFASGDANSVCQSSYYGEGGGCFVGASVGGGGDIDGDGFDDIILGGYGYQSSKGIVYLIHPFTNSRAEPSMTLVYEDPTRTTLVTKANVNDTVYIKVDGNDTDDTVTNTMNVIVSSSSDPVGFRMTLRETGDGTGVFHGDLFLGTRTRKDDDWIKAMDGNTVTVACLDDLARNYTFLISDSIKIKPAMDISTAVEDEPYSNLYHVVGTTSATWSLETNAEEWLSFNTTNGNLSGTPDNRHSGRSYWVYLNASDDVGPTTDSRFFWIDVINVAPTVYAPANDTAYEDQMFYVDFNCSDDGQGDMGWSLIGNSPEWLFIDHWTGIVNGTPDQSDVGSDIIQVMVMDGNGGETEYNHSISIEDVNDDPVIVGTANKTAREDHAYYCNHTAFDPDAATILTWSWHTNSSWLERSSGNLFGTPLQADVGQCFVNLTVSDNNGGSVSKNFTITVSNVNDVPLFDSVPKANETIEIDVVYSFDVDASDEDNDTLTYSMTSVPMTNAVIDPDTGLINWTPIATGEYQFNLTVWDGHVTISHSFILFVVGEGQVPSGLIGFTSTPSTSATVGMEYTYTATATASSGNLVLFTLEEGPEGMRITGSTITWTPTAAQVGKHNVSIMGTDTIVVGYQNFTLTVTNTGGTENPPPNAEMIPKQAAKVGERFTFQVNGSDPDGGAVEYEIEEGPDGMTISPTTGAVQWEPSEGDEGSHIIVIKVIDDEDQNTTVSFTIEVEGSSSSEFNPLFIILGVIAFIVLLLLIVIIIVIVLVTRKKSKPDDTAHRPTEPVVIDAEPIMVDGPEGPAALPSEEAPAIDVTPPSELEGEVMSETTPAIEDDLTVQPDHQIEAEPQLDLLALPPAKIIEVEEDPLDTLEITEALIVTKEGLLVNHYARNPDDELDRDILSAMLTAVQSFVKDSFSSKDATIRRLEMQDFTVLIEPGQYINIVGITADRQNRELEDHLKRMMREVEKEMGDTLKDWDGDVARLKGIEVFVQKLLSGGYEV